MIHTFRDFELAVGQEYANRAAVDLNIPSASATATGAAMVTTAMERMAAMTVVNFMVIMW